MKTHNKRLTVSPATLKDVAQRAGVSHSTVSRAINHPDLLNQETLEAVREAIKELDYTPNPFARGLQTASSKTVALIVPNMQNLSFANYAAGAQKTLEAERFSLILASSAEDREREKFICKNLNYHGIDGVIFASSTGGIPPIELLPAKTIKVLIERVAPGGEYDAFFLDIDGGVMNAIQHLEALGHRKIAIILGNKAGYSSKQRLYAFKQALTALKIPFYPEYVETGDWNPRGGWMAMDKLLQLPDPPTAVFATTDTMAMGAIGSAAANGLRIPRDISIIGFDNEPGSGEFNPPLTTLDACSFDMGVHAAEVLLKRLNEPGRPYVQIMYPLELVHRASTGPAPRR
jgi:LacI family transcriptional regulator